MDQLRSSFEKALQNKLSQKATPTQGEEIVLMKNFRYFDTDNDGFVSLPEWCKAIEKIGVVVPTFEDLKQLFYMYDLNGDGKIDCKEFPQILYGRIKPKYGFNKEAL